MNMKTATHVAWVRLSRKPLKGNPEYRHTTRGGGEMVQEYLYSATLPNQAPNQQDAEYAFLCWGADFSDEYGEAQDERWGWASWALLCAFVRAFPEMSMTPWGIEGMTSRLECLGPEGFHLSHEPGLGEAEILVEIPFWWNKDNCPSWDRYKFFARPPLFDEKGGDDE